MAAVEASSTRTGCGIAARYFLLRVTTDPTDDKATGFDAIFDDPNFVGGQFSYWNRQGIRLVSTEVGLVPAKQPFAELCVRVRPRVRQIS